MSIENLESKENIEINWVRPDIRDEGGEIERTAHTFVASEAEYPAKLREVIDSISTAEFEELTQEMWAQLENTESWEQVRPGHIEDAQKFAEEYKRDWQSLLQAMKEGSPIKAPIIIVNPDGIPYLVSGNTRLMLSRALEVRVRALIARMGRAEKE